MKYPGIRFQVSALAALLLVAESYKVRIEKKADLRAFTAAQMINMGYGCCRDNSGNIPGTDDKTFLTMDACKQRCLANPSCSACDISKPVLGKNGTSVYECHNYMNYVNSIAVGCDTTDLNTNCYRKSGVQVTTTAVPTTTTTSRNVAIWDISGHPNGMIIRNFVTNQRLIEINGMVATTNASDFGLEQVWTESKAPEDSHLWTNRKTRRTFYMRPFGTVNDTSWGFGACDASQVLPGPVYAATGSADPNMVNDMWQRLDIVQVAEELFFFKGLVSGRRPFDSANPVRVAWYSSAANIRSYAQPAPQCQGPDYCSTSSKP